MKFYANKFQIRAGGYHGSDNEKMLPEGTIFKVNAIDGMMIELRAIKKDNSDLFILVSPDILRFGFTETESI